ncbi:hypothetical protein CTAYLR_008818 [Chrysophaeum taylorii]|uniref:Fe2OG dioxygenase domain-containing protein n=1 Tax=Chrysophaeum taylorii TaxID=2483200 RepID=A0AAD7XK46_9STRA|nr:hypothetical protein CTAYLR_008818 [Chrysophaeum taylorii]
MARGQREWMVNGQLNAWRQGRGRAYVATFAPLDALCEELVAIAADREPGVAPRRLRHTHVLLLYYQKLKGIGWHRDDGPNDGASDEPVVSLSLGCECDFAIKDSQRSIETTVRLRSGDAILFGGPSKRIMHAVTAIYPGTNPLGGGDCRLNLTFRHAPELCGLERTDRFFHFGAVTRRYLHTERTRGTDVARAEVMARRLARQKKKTSSSIET